MGSTTNPISIGTLNVEEGSGYVATFVQSFAQPEATINRALRDGDSSVVTAVAPGLHTYFLAVVVDDVGVAADTIDARRRALMRALDATAGPITVTIENAAGTARRRWMRFVVRKVDQIENQFGQGFMATLEAADDVRWRATETQEVTWTFNESGQQIINNIGDLVARPVVTVRPTGEKTGGNWVYMRRFILRWKSPFSGETILDVTGGGLNTTALLAADKITTAANIAVHLNGRYVPFWFGNADGQAGGFNSTTTRINVALTVPRRITLETAEYISETATTWRVRDDGGLPPSGVLDVAGEYIYYNSRAPGVLYGVRRGLYGTTPDYYIAGQEAEVIPAVGYILYGPDAAVPAEAKTLAYRQAELRPPIIANGSTNSEWIYQQFAGDRPGDWTLAVVGRELAFYSESAGNGWYDPAGAWPWTAMGLEIGFSPLVAFEARFAVPIDEVEFSGRHWAEGSPAQYPNSARLYALDDEEANRRQLWNSAAGVARDVNAAFSVTAAIPSTDDTPLYNRLSWQMSQSNYVQADMQTVTVRFRNEYLPEIALAAEETPYDLALEIRNWTTNDAMRIDSPNAAPGLGLVIDAEEQTVTDEDTGANAFAAVTTSWTQERFMTLAPGANTIAVTEEVMGTVEVIIRYEPRWYT